MDGRNCNLAGFDSPHLGDCITMLSHIHTLDLGESREPGEIPFLPTFCNRDSKTPYRIDRFCNDSLQNVDSRENGIDPFSLLIRVPFLLSGFSSVDGTTFCNEIVTKKNVDRMRERSRWRIEEVSMDRSERGTNEVSVGDGVDPPRVFSSGR